MALLSPGVQVSVTDESFSTGSGPGTVPLVFVATKQDKTTPDGTAIASGTTAANANNLYLITSQRELLQTFGNPDFNEVGGSAQNGYPLNEYGLLAAYSYLGVANRAYVIRADLDLSELEPSTTEPAAAAADGTYWVDLGEFTPGLFEYDVSAGWVPQTVEVIVNPDDTTFNTATNVSGRQVGDRIAVFFPSAAGTAGFHIEYYEFGTGGVWIKIDGDNGAFGNVFWGAHYNVPASPGAGDVWLKTTTPNSGLSINLKLYDATLGQFLDQGTVPVFRDPTEYYGQAGVSSLNVAAGTVLGFVDSNGVAAATDGAEFDITLQAHNGSSSTVAAGTVAPTLGNVDVGGADDFTITLGRGGTPVTVVLDGVPYSSIDDLITDINTTIAITTSNIVAGKTTTSTGQTVLTITALDGRDVIIADGTGTPLADANLIAPGTYSNFVDLDVYAGTDQYFAQTAQPTTGAAYGTYWYDPSFTVDLLIKNSAGQWYDILAADMFVQADEPTANSVNSIWVETDTGTSYPVVYRRNTGNTAWVVVDNADQTTPLGIVFADARDELNVPATKTAVDATATLDSDAPSPAIYPAGTLLWNTRASGRNVKVYTQNAVTGPVIAARGTNGFDRWVSASGNNNDGSLIAGPAAQKAVVVQALAATLTANEDIRNDTIFYNLIAAPGFPELMDEMLALNTDRKEQAFVIGDTPFNLASNATALQAWASNANNAVGNGDDGLVSASEYLGVYYPSGLSTNVDGSEVVVPASHMVLRQLAFNDQVAYPWFAPAGFTRGTISNASAVGYLDSEDEFVTVTLNEGQRDTLYNNNVNAIATLPGRGIVIWGQKTRYATSGALDRVNVARLVNYIRFQSDQLAQPFLFEPNDSVTRDAIKEAFDSFLSELVTLRGVTDFLVVVDESNNTPARIDRNELWVDIAIQPTKAVEFIYIPIRLQNTSDDLNL